MRWREPGWVAAKTLCNRAGAAGGLGWVGPASPGARQDWSDPIEGIEVRMKSDPPEHKRERRMTARGAVPEDPTGEEPDMTAQGAIQRAEADVEPRMTAHGAEPAQRDRPKPRMTASGAVTDQEEEEEEEHPEAPPTNS